MEILLNFSLGKLVFYMTATYVLCWLQLPLPGLKRRYSILSVLLSFLKYGGLHLKLPRRVPTIWLMKYQWKYGFFNAHKMVGEMFKLKQTNIVRVTPYGKDFVFVSDPEMIKEVLTNREVYPTRGHTGFSTYVPNGLLGLPTGDRWALHRRLISRYLSTRYLNIYSEVISEEADILCAKWANVPGNRVDAHYDLSCCALDIIGRIAFGKNFGSQTDPAIKYYEALDVVLNETVRRTVEPRLLWYINPVRAWKFRQADGYLRTDIRKFIANGPKGENIMSHLLRNRGTDEGDLTKEELEEEVGTLMGAGHETTSNTLCWSLYLLAQHPDKLALLQAEVDKLDYPLRYDTLHDKHMPYTLAVFYETLRLYPTVPQFPREVAHNTKLGGYDIPKGSFVFVSQRALSFNEKYFPNCAVFEPERFLDAKEPAPSRPIGAPSGPDYAFVPFGAGPRTCVGQRLAVCEGTLLLANIVHKFDIALANPGETVDEHSDITLGPKQGLNLIVTARNK